LLALAGCKINIGLQVVSKRSDGFHNIESVMYPIPWYDVVELNEIASLEDKSFDVVDGVACQISGLKVAGNITSNLCYKAYQLLAHDFDLPEVVIHLHKNIPMGAGLGGGSSDAVKTLSLLCKMFQLKVSNKALQQYTTALGSDCTFFIEDKPAFASGKGEIQTPINLSLAGMHITLLKPDVSINTAQAYAHIKPGATKHLLQNIKLPIEKWHTAISNDFEKFAMQQHPIIAQIKDALYQQGCIYAAMSGSGSCVYGISYSPININFENTLKFTTVLN
jgi:4-diphosphocytidyl-2-C-methyl-D-erythritol kinase